MSPLKVRTMIQPAKAQTVMKVRRNSIMSSNRDSTELPQNFAFSQKSVKSDIVIFD